MPRYPVERSTNFIIEEESWTVVEYDHTSVPGVIYLSLTEGKINSIYDDVENNLADTDKIANYELSVPVDNQVFAIGDNITTGLKFTLTKNGIPSVEPVNILTTNKKIAKKDPTDENLYAVGNGEVELVIQLKNYPSNVVHTTIIVSDTPQDFSGYIEGDATIHLDRKASYTLKGTEEVIGTVNYSIDNDKLVFIQSIENNICVLQANKKNLLGSFILTADYLGQQYTKEITIIPLW